MRQVPVVHDLAHQLVQVFHERHTGIAVARHAQGLQHDVAELVCGRDGRRVEAGERIPQPPLACVPLGGDQILRQIRACR
ncbi:Uncharacterised protein [Mycobacteroides abscessus subsp. abscessus]|nr:Uncharacterised protein [Mycobacteroides abscessus subsp. abscessus]